MSLANVAEGTPRVLRNYLNIIDSPSAHEPDYNIKFHSAPVTPKKYESHPDIQFFRLVKTKHHFAYHKSKLSLSSKDRASERSKSKLPGFEPFNRDQLLERLRSYNALNWHIPPGKNNGVQLNELLCAASGWKCQSIARNNNVKNHLLCTKCGNELILRFNAEEEQPDFAPFHFDLEDIHEVNLNLKAQYVQQVQELGHQPLCPWTKVLTPVNTVYYLTPYLASTNDTLVSGYLLRLKGLFDNLLILQEHVDSLMRLCPAVEEPEKVPDFCRVSNLWLISRFFNSDKENLGVVLSKSCPPWLYFVAAMGWDMFTQEFNGKTILLMICQSCNQRIFLQKSEGLLNNGVERSSQIRKLSPCEFSANFSKAPSKFSNEYLFDEEEEEMVDPYFEHKPWCCQVSDMAGQPYFQYFVRTIASLEEYIGQNGEYLVERDESLDMDIDGAPRNPKRKVSFDLKEELEKFHKLRKPYFGE